MLVNGVLGRPSTGAAGTTQEKVGVCTVLSRSQAIFGCFLLAIVTLAFFSPVLAGSTSSTVPSHQNSIWPWRATPTPFTEVLPQTDQADTYHPWQTYISRSLRNGTLPLWNRHSFGGAPFLANGQNGTLYPPRAALGLLVSASWAHDLFMMTHMFFAGVAMFVLLRELRCVFFGALFGAVVWMLNAHVLGWMQLEFIGPLTVFLPASIACVARFKRKSGWPPLVAAGLCLALIVIGGQVQMAAFSGLIVGGYALAVAWPSLIRALRSHSLRDAARQVVLLAIIPSVALSASAVVLVPTMLAAREIGRIPLPYSTMVDDFAMPLSRYIHALWPPGLPFTQEHILGFSILVGTPTVVLAVIGVLTRRRGAGLGGVGCVGTILLTMGTPLTWLAYHVVPGFGFVILGRLHYVFVFGMALLAGLGMAAVWELASAQGFRVRSAVHVVAAVALLGTTAQLFWYGRQINPRFAPRRTEFLYPQTKLIEALELDRGSHGSEEPQRFIPVARGAQDPGVWHPPVLYTSQHMVFGLDSVGGYDSVVPDRVSDLWRVVGGASPKDVLANPMRSALLASYAAGSVRFDLLPRVGVTTVVTPPDIGDDPGWTAAVGAVSGLERIYTGPDGMLFDLPGVHPGAWVAFSEEVVKGRRAALNRFTDPTFDHRRSVLLEEHRGRRRSPAPRASVSGAAVVSAVRRGTNTVSIDVESSEPGWLVVADTWAPGWTARVNGRSTEVRRANYTFRAVPVPSGKAHVAMSYRPPGFIGGLLVSGAAWAVCGSALLIHAFTGFSRRPQRQSSTFERRGGPVRSSTSGN